MISSLGIPRDEITYVLTGGQNTSIRGTYLHPLLIPPLAGWIHPSFAISAAKLVNDFIVDEYRREVRKLKGDNQTLLEKVDGLASDNKVLISNNNELLTELRGARAQISQMDERLKIANENIIETLDTLGVVSNKQVPLERVKRPLLEEFVLVHTDKRNYQVIRTQKRATSTSLRRIRQQYPKAKIIVRMESRPNSKELWNAIKEKLIEVGCSTTKNDIELTEDVSEDRLLDIIRQINNEKFNILIQTRDSIKRTYLSEEEEETGDETKDETASDSDTEEDANPRMTANQLLLKSKPDLMEIARATGKRGYSKLKKVELVNWILNIH